MCDKYGHIYYYRKEKEKLTALLRLHVVNFKKHLWKTYEIRDEKHN